MALYKVDSDTADLTKVAGGTLYADLPIGSWIKNDMATIPSGFLKEGDTISQSEYPELYAKYGSTVPYKSDKSELSEYENITLSTNSSNPTVMPYDGVYILANYGVSYIHHIYLNGIEISAGITGNNTTGASTSSTILFKKGDTMYRLNTYTESTFLEHVAYYKKSLIVKAKHTPVPADFMDAIDDVIKDATVDAVTNGDMNPVTSNAVYDAMNSVDFATILSETANVSIGDYICSKNIKNVCAMIKGRTSSIVPPSTKICSGFFTPLTPSTYAYLDIPFAIRNRTTNVTEMRMGYLDINGDFYTSAYTKNIESDWDIQLFFSYITD